MMSSKSSRKMIKNIRSSPMRKEHVMRKSVRSSPPLRSSRPPPMKRISPEMKRGHRAPSSNKNLHSPRMRSIASSPHRSVAHHTMPSSPDSIDRSRYKRSKFEKRKNPSISPVRHPSPPPPIPRDHRGSPPYHDDRYLNSRHMHEERLPAPTPKKKIRRESERFSHDPSPVLHKSNDIPFISDGTGLTLRSEIGPHNQPMPVMSRNYLSQATHTDRIDRNFRSHHSPPPASHQPKRQPPPPIKSSYDNSERYKSDLPSAAYLTEDDKGYPLTLHERFSTVETVRTEPRIRYSREDLEKITIDIRRNLRDHSPTLRQIVNPNDIKLVRRNNEGHRPIFDRDEIKQAPKDMREEAYSEKKMSSEGQYHHSHSIDLRDVDNYEITRHRFDGHPPPHHSSNSRPLSDRWQNPDGRKDMAPLDRDEREREFEKLHSKKRYMDVRNRSKSRDTDLRSDRYAMEEMTRSKSNYRVDHSHSIQSELRPSVIHHKESSHPEMRRRLGMKKDRMSPPSRSEARSHYPSSEKRYSESLSRAKHIDRRSPAMPSPKYRQRSRSGGRDEKMSDYPRRPDKYSYKSWPDKRDSFPASYIPPGKESLDSYRGRGGSRPFRSRGFRSRGFRGGSRGSFRSRGSFTSGYRGSVSLRGRGAPRRGRLSPHLWEHDMYSRMSPDGK